MIQNALLVLLAYFVVEAIDAVLGWKTMQRPIVAATVAGLLLGDIQIGIIMGAALEGIFMGISQIGGTVPSDASSAAVISVAMTILAGTDMETGLALAMPIGTIMITIHEMWKPVLGSLSTYWEKLAGTGNINKFRTHVVICGLTVDKLPRYIVLFCSIAFGVEGLQLLVENMPPEVMRGLSAASGMMTGVGFAILTSMIWDKEVGGFFFVGFVLSKYLGLGTLPIAIVMTVVAMMYFYNDKKFVDMRKIQMANGNFSNNEEEDFF